MPIHNVFAAQGSAIAEEAIKRIAQLYGVEKQARGQSPEARAALRQENAKPIFDDLEEWLRDQLPKTSGKSPLAKAIRYALGRMPKTRPYLDNGFLELDNNTAERAMKPVAIGRKNWMFAGSQRGGNSMAIAFTLIETAKLNGVDPQAWLTWVLECIFRDIRPPIPTTSAHLYRGIRPALTRCREALVFDISFLAFRHVVEGLSFGRIVRRVRAGRRCAPAGRGWHLRRWVHQ